MRRPPRTRSATRWWPTPHISEDELSCARYVLRDDRAATQLFRVTSSLDSMVVGESEIQGQVRQAWEIAAEEGASGAILNQLFRQALEVGKQVRAQTRIGAGSASVSAVAVELAEEVLDDLPGRQVLLIGAGRMAESDRPGARRRTGCARSCSPTAPSAPRASWRAASAGAASASTASRTSCGRPTS